MKLERVLGVLILSEFVLGVLATISYFALAPFLPAQLRAYIAADESASSRFYDTLLLALSIVVVVATVIAWVGLLNLLRAARSLYLASWVGYLVLPLLRGPVVCASVSFALEMMTALVGGGILAMIYFSTV